MAQPAAAQKTVTSEQMRAEMDTLLAVEEAKGRGKSITTQQKAELIATLPIALHTLVDHPTPNVGKFPTGTFVQKALTYIANQQISSGQPVLASYWEETKAEAHSSATGSEIEAYTLKIINDMKSGAMAPRTSMRLATPGGGEFDYKDKDAVIKGFMDGMNIVFQPPSATAKPGRILARTEAEITAAKAQMDAKMDALFSGTSTETIPAGYDDGRELFRLFILTQHPEFVIATDKAAPKKVTGFEQIAESFVKAHPNYTQWGKKEFLAYQEQNPRDYSDIKLMFAFAASPTKTVTKGADVTYNAYVDEAKHGAFKIMPDKEPKAAAAFLNKWNETFDAITAEREASRKQEQAAIQKDWNEIEQLNAKIKKDFDSLAKTGHLTKQEQEKDAELRNKVEEAKKSGDNDARAVAEKNLLYFEQAAFERISKAGHKDVPNVKEPAGNRSK